MVKTVISINEDEKHVEHVRKLLKENDGYCPCALLKNDDTKCMCKAFRTQVEDGYCHCMLYKKTSH